MSSRLPTRDIAFLTQESTRAPLHVATLAILDPGDAGFDHDTLVQSINERIAFVPRYRQRLVSAPAGLGRPVWLDDEDFDLTYHVRRSALPRPGSMDQLRELVARLLARRLDRHRPLWEAYLVEGLTDERVALLIKSHQALVDGTDTVDLAQVLLEETNRVRDVPGDHWRPRTGPGPVQMLVESALDSLRHPRQAADVATSAAWRLASALPVLPGLPARRSDHRGPLAATLSQQRRFVTVATRLEDYRTVREAHAGTVNDVILATITGGLRGWMLTRGEQIRATTRLRAMVPMSVVDAEAEPTSLGSHVVGHQLSLPVGESNPVVRLHQVSYALKAHRETGRAVAANRLSALPGFAPTTFHVLGARIVHQQPPGSYQLAITNVPGPQDPLFISGARMVETYPALPLTEGHAVAIGVTSYDGGVYLGIVADRDAVPDADVLGQCLVEALEELVATATPSRVRAPRGRARPEAPRWEPR
ncbi:MAG: wax ester/triacylglycerol synthase family O-acyltransferase [Actinomycetota bacterium]|nr:wax ester/triacylglycerol synthase family O-acyltransferase [Actinomycetota bacterium]